jgi:hypothetical protein
MYASKIPVNKNPKKITTTKKKSLGYDGELTITALKKLGLKDNDTFYVIEDENTTEAFLYYTVTRVETAKETLERVAKEVQYNENFEKFHAKNLKTESL